MIMKKMFSVLFVMLFVSATTFSQNYPKDPSISKIASDLKSQDITKEFLTNFNYKPEYLKTGKFRFAKKSELKDYFYEKWYWRSDYAYNISRNKNYRDMRSFSVFLETPKDADGISHKIFFKVTYTRRNENNFEDNKWNFDYCKIDPIECVTYGLPELSDEERKQMMLDYIKKQKGEQEALTHRHHPINKLIKVDSVMAYSHYSEYYKPKGATLFLWTLTVLGDYSNRINNNGGTERVEKNYLKIPFEVVYKDGEFVIQNALYYNSISQYIDSDAPGRDALYNSADGNRIDLDNPIWYATWSEKGLEAIMKKSYEKEEPAGSESFIEKRMAEIEKALESFNTQDPQKIESALKPYMHPDKADELASSYADLAKGFVDKLCTLKVGASSDIQYNYEMGDTSGPYVKIYMSISRERARTKELQKKYKAAGMSKQVRKSTSRGSENGRITNTSYRQKFELQLINDNWYIVDEAEPDQVKIKF